MEKEDSSHQRAEPSDKRKMMLSKAKGFLHEVEVIDSKGGLALKLVQEAKARREELSARSLKVRDLISSSFI